MPAASCPPLIPAVRVVSGQPCQLGESPLWHPLEGALYWVDIAGQAILRAVDPVSATPSAGAHQRWPLDDQPACLAPAANGTLVVGLRRGVAHFVPATGELHLLANAPWDIATTRSNDGRCDPAGRFWVGTVFEPKTANHASLYCLQPRPPAAAPAAIAPGLHDAPPDWVLVPVLHDNLTANGLAFEGGAGLAWWSNTPAHVIRQYPFSLQDGRFGAPRVFHQFAPRVADAPYGGRPDGACLDSAGHYWVAMYEGGRVLRLDPQGTIVLDVRLPVTCPTMVCLGGADLRTLFITSASKGRPVAELAAEPLAGHVLAVHLDQLDVPAGVRGLPADLFDAAPARAPVAPVG